MESIKDHHMQRSLENEMNEHFASLLLNGQVT